MLYVGIIFFFFVIWANLQNKSYITSFVPSWFWWIAHCEINGLKQSFIQFFVQVDTHTDYTKRFSGYLGLNSVLPTLKVLTVLKENLSGCC